MRYPVAPDLVDAAPGCLTVLDCPAVAAGDGPGPETEQ